MARLTIDLPEKNLFSTEIAVRVTDLNYGGHLGNDTVLTLIQEARVQFYRQIGFESELRFEGNIGQIISDAAVVYKSESFLGDVLVFTLGIRDMNKYGFDMICQIVNKATSKEVARVKTGIVCFDYSTRKVVRIPQRLLERLS
jgi:acyl-CoA thioester hydrolase